MNKIDIVRKAFNLSTPIKERDSLYSDDFQASDAVGGPSVDKKTWLAMGEMYRSSLPDAGFIIDEIHQEGEDVLATGHFTGTFLHDFDLSALNMGVIKATGKPVKFPPSTSRVSFRGDKILHNKSLATGPDAGLAGFIATLKNGGE